MTENVNLWQDVSIPVVYPVTVLRKALCLSEPQAERSKTAKLAGSPAFLTRHKKMVQSFCPCWRFA